MNKTQYIFSKIDNNRYCKNNGQFTRHIRKHGLTYKDYYEIYETGYTPICLCLKPLTFYQKNESYANSCGNPKCVGRIISETKQNWDEETRNRDSCNKRLAARVKTSEQIQNQINKSKKTFLEKYGVEWISKSSVQKEKAKNTKLAKYGIMTYNNSQVSSEKNRNKSIKEKEIINNKRRKTNLEKYGVENTYLRPDVIKKSRVSNAQGKDYNLPSGKVIKVKGYENIVLDNLLKNYNECDLIIHIWGEKYQLPVFDYIDHRRHHLKYYPDIYIPRENKIIEVKGRWWWDGNGDIKYVNRLENNLRKYKSVIGKGYVYEVWLFNNPLDFKILKNEKDFQT